MFLIALVRRDAHRRYLCRRTLFGRHRNDIRKVFLACGHKIHRGVTSARISGSPFRAVAASESRISDSSGDSSDDSESPTLGGNSTSRDRNVRFLIRRGPLRMPTNSEDSVHRRCCLDFCYFSNRVYESAATVASLTSRVPRDSGRGEITAGSYGN